MNLILIRLEKQAVSQTAMKSKNIEQGIFYSILFDLALEIRSLKGIKIRVKELELDFENTQDNNFDFCACNVVLFSLNKF